MIRNLVYQLHDLLDYIDWSYFFHAWGMPPRFVSIADVHHCKACRQSWVDHWEGTDHEQAQEAERLHRDAVALLRQLDGRYEVLARFGLFPAWSEGDDVVLRVSGDVADNCQATSAVAEAKEIRIPFLRQQTVKSADEPMLCLADFIAPRGVFPEVDESLLIPAQSDTPRGQVLGAFVTAVDPEMEQLFPDDDYRRMLVQTLADRMAEAAAEKMHEEVRQIYWGYAKDEHFTKKELFVEKYEGRRPAIGYPSIPDQSINFILDELLQMSAIKVKLTDSGMMCPHAAVSGLLFDHPATRHFAVGAIGEDQLADYAGRRGYPVEQCRRFLQANLKK